MLHPDVGIRIMLLLAKNEIGKNGKKRDQKYAATRTLFGEWSNLV